MVTILGGRQPDATAAMTEVRRGIDLTGSDERSALLWLYIGLLIGHRHPDVAGAMGLFLERFMPEVLPAQAAAEGIAKASRP